MNTIVIATRGPVKCPGYFNDWPLVTALVEATRVVLVHPLNYDAHVDLAGFLYRDYRDNKRFFNTLSIEHHASFTDVTHAVTLNVELDPGQQRKYRSALQLKWKAERRLRAAKELWKRWDDWHDYHKLGDSGRTARTITVPITTNIQPIPFSAENLLSRSRPPSCCA